MRIKEIFENPIDRIINPAVVVGDEDVETISAEIREYIFTPEIAENLYKMLHAIAGKSAGKTGIWINGYYGSGKSHFLKFAHYCMAPDYQQAAFDHYEEAVAKLDLEFSDATPSNVRSLRKKMESADIDNILFNVEAVSGDGKSNRLTRIFLNQLNGFRGYNATDIPLARLLEKELDKAGQFETFKAKLKEKNFDWATQATTIAKLYIDVALEIAAELLPGLSTDVLRATLKNPDTYEVSINDTLLPELKEYLATKGPGYRLVFLVDEISQYIGRNKDTLLNLQTIVEAVGEKLGHKVWIACTAQQNIDEVVDGVDSVDKKDEFGKILGRFDTRINLESNDPAYITQKRVLEKSSAGLRELAVLYKDHKDAIDNQFALGSDLYKGFSTEEDFTLSYPFVPYQFKLIADVFYSFQQLKYVVTEVKDNTRSVIGITHFTVKQLANEGVGGFVPFDAFYNGQLETNLQHTGSRVISRALEQNKVKQDPFAQRVAKALFMVSHLSNEVQRIIPPTAEVLTILLMKQIDENKLELRQKITDVLTILKEASVIREEEGAYFFYNEDEVAVTAIIDSQTVNSDEKSKMVYDGFFAKLLRTTPNKVTVGQNDFSFAFAVDDKRMGGNGDVAVNLAVYERVPFAERALNTPTDLLVIGVSELFWQDAQLRQDVEWYLKVEAYLNHNTGAADKAREQTNLRFRERNNILADSIRKRLAKCIMAAPCISGQQVVESSRFAGTDTVKRYASMLETHITTINKHLKLAASYPATEDELRRDAARTDAEMIKELTEPERMVNDAISRNGDRRNVEVLLQEFTRKPYSWRYTQVLGILLSLQRKGMREFEYNNTPRFAPAAFIEKAIKTPNRTACIVRSSEAISVAEVEDALAAFNKAFNTVVPHTTDAVTLFESMRRTLEKGAESCRPLLEQWSAAPFVTHFRKYSDLVQEWLALREPKALLNKAVAEAQNAHALHDSFTTLKDFVGRSAKDYNAMRDFATANSENFSRLSPEAGEKGEWLRSFLLSENPQTEFRHLKKAVEELKAEITGYLSKRKEEVVTSYTALFTMLRQEAEKAGVEANGVLPDEEAFMEKIGKISNVADMHVKGMSVNDFKTEQLTAIFKRKDEQDAARKPAGKGVPTEVGEAVLLYISTKFPTISNETEMEAFLSDLKTQMLAMLHQNKTIIIKE